MLIWSDVTRLTEAERFTSREIWQEALSVARPRWTVSTAPIAKRAMRVAPPKKGERGGD